MTKELLSAIANMLFFIMISLPIAIVLYAGVIVMCSVKELIIKIKSICQKITTR
jgi:hypothetical protein